MLSLFKLFSYVLFNAQILFYKFSQGVNCEKQISLSWNFHYAPSRGKLTLIVCSILVSIRFTTEFLLLNYFNVIITPDRYPLSITNS